MPPQSYQHHRRYYWVHHFIFYPVCLLFLTATLYQAFNDPALRLVWLAVTGLILLLVMLALMLRQHYALNNQNRIIRLELRLRYYQLTHQSFEALEPRLSLPQLFALRFAPDEELPALVDKTLRENLSANAIKKAIKNWLPDHMRV